jgi:hypothetical protein
MPVDLEAERLALERERLREEVRQRDEELALQRLQIEASVPKPETRSWRTELRTVFLGSLPLLTALVAPTIGLVQFGLSQEYAAQAAAEARKREAELGAATARLEARKAFDAKKLQLYAQAITVSGKLAAEPVGSIAFKKAQQEFERLYWAELPLVETEPVERAMIQLRGAIYGEDVEEINQRVIDLARAVRGELNQIYQR